MTTTTIYTVSIYNETPINTVLFKGESIWQADLTVDQAKEENKHGVVLATVITENKEFDYKKQETKILKNF